MRTTKATGSRRALVPGFGLLLLAASTVVGLCWARYASLGRLDLDREFPPPPWPLVNVAVLAAALAAALAGHARLVRWAEAMGPAGAGSVRRVALLLCLASSLMLPLLSSDLFSLLAYVDLAWQRGVDPYTLPGLGLMASPYFPLLDWTSAPCVYGPVQLLFWAPAVLAPVSLLAQVVGTRLLALLAAASIVLLLDRHLAGRPDRAATLALVAANPVLWIEGVGQAHNDVLAAAFLALWLLLASRGHLAFAAAAMGLALASKLTVALPAVMWVVYLAGRPGRLRDRGRDVLLASAVMAAVLAVSYGVVWKGTETLTRPLGFLAERGPTHTWAEAIRLLGRQFGLDRDQMSQELGRLSGVLTALLALLGAVRAWRAKDFSDMLESSAKLLLLSLTVAASVFHPWYFVPALVLCAELRSPEWRRWLLVASTASILVSAPVLLPHAHARSALSFVVSAIACLLWVWGLRDRGRSLWAGTGATQRAGMRRPPNANESR